MRRWFHCTTCDGYSEEPIGFKEIKHFVKCSCGSTMYMHVIGTPEEGAITTEVKGTLIPQSEVSG